MTILLRCLLPAAIGALLLPVAVAQSSSASSSETTNATFVATAPTTLQDLLLQALQANLEIQARRIEPQIHDDRIKGA